MPSTIAHRIMGGSPLAVIGRLLVVSLLVGALTSWLDVDPLAIVDWLEFTALRLWASGFQSLHLVGHYIVTGAILVLPIWLVLRLTSIGARDSGPRTGRWTLPGAPEGGVRPSPFKNESRG